MISASQYPLVSVIIPVFNGERYLAETLESVLAQTYPHYEIIAIDDASGSDAGLDIVRQYAPGAHIYYHKKNKGLGATRNSGVKLSQGELLAFLDDDDFWTADKLAKQVEVLCARPDIDMVFARVEQFISPDVPAAQQPAEPLQKIVDGIHAGTMLISREKFELVGSFATKWRLGEFVEWYSRALARGLKSTVLPQVMMYRRLHAHNMSREFAHERSDYLKILKAKLDRQRNPGNG